MDTKVDKEKEKYENVSILYFSLVEDSYNVSYKSNSLYLPPQQ